MAKIAGRGKDSCDIAVFNYSGLVHTYHNPEGQAINADYCIGILLIFVKNLK